MECTSPSDGGAAAAAEPPDWKPNAAFLAACESLGLDEASDDAPPPMLAQRGFTTASSAASEAPAQPLSSAAVEAFGGYADTGPDELETAVQSARVAKARGNELLAGGDAAAAVARYEAALVALEAVAARARQVLLGRRLLARDATGERDTPLATAARDSKSLTADCRLNLAAAKLALGDPAGALAACDAAAEVQDHTLEAAKAVKAHFRAATALERLGRLQDAERRLDAAAELAPGDKLVVAAIRRVREKRRDKRKKEPKASFKGLFA